MEETRIILAESRVAELHEGVKCTRHSIDQRVGSKASTRVFGKLEVFTETTLGAGYTECLRSGKPMQLFVLPLVGKLGVDKLWRVYDVDVEEALLTSVDAQDDCFFLNDYKKTNSHFLVAGFSSPEPVEGIALFSPVQNQLQSLFKNVSQKGLKNVSVGMYEGRQTDELSISPGNKAFAWVVQGAFEFQDCLLQKSDGLAISGTEKLEFEALANDSIIILFEFSE